mmetsp:Transcript_107681/g.195947  ORF Transcript_107681/g.195947 Transcript_107681/m.195947 type:complete len:368 (+) Transcript_107681:29-1132(+)
MAVALLEKNSVFFRFSSDGIVEKVEFHGREIAVGDLKQAIADRKNLPKYDLVLVNEATNETYNREGHLLRKNTSVTVRRMPPQSLKKPTLAVVEHRDIWKKMTPVHDLEAPEERPDAIEKQAFPPAYLCPLCRDIFENPCIARCCGRSACFSCFEEQKGNDCPLCRRPFSEETQPIPNPRLADTVSSLNLDYFELPKTRERQEEERATKGMSQRVASRARAGAEPVAVLNPGALQTPWTIPSPLPSPCPSPFSWPPSSPASPPPSPLPGPPAGPALQPCMLTPEQFHLWQQSIAMEESESSSSSSSRARRRRSKKEKKKRSKKKRKHADGVDPGYHPDVLPAEAGEGQKSHRKTKKRRSECDYQQYQ